MRNYNLNIIVELPAPLNERNSKLVSEVTGNRISFVYGEKFNLLLAGWLFIAISVFLGLITNRDSLEEYWGVLLFFVLLAIILLIIGYSAKKKYWILDRTNQNISIPLNFKKEPIVKSAYEVKAGYYIQTGGKYAMVPTAIPVVWHESKKPFRNTSALTTWSGDNQKGADIFRTWSFYIWYLDKNRPLPPGEMLDPYREEDFRRRKAEGFPPPLFCSCIPTLEATPEQQAEREQYWKDKDYMFRLDRYRESRRWNGLDRTETELNIEDSAILINKWKNPEKWELKAYPEFKNFKYLPVAYAMRYEFEDGKIVYSVIEPETGKVCTPPKGLAYSFEIIR